ncbi:hypothetical protein L2E74_23560 [Planktothrix agardhii 1026]|nr:hypothetical protein [Planktothrix agardhii 1026]
MALYDMDAPPKVKKFPKVALTGSLQQIAINSMNDITGVVASLVNNNLTDTVTRIVSLVNSYYRQPNLKEDTIPMDYRFTLFSLVVSDAVQ